MIAIAFAMALVVGTVSGGVYYFKGKAAGRAAVQLKFDQYILGAKQAGDKAAADYAALAAAWRAERAAAKAEYDKREADNAKTLAAVRAARDADIIRLRNALSRPSSGAAPGVTSAPGADDCAAVSGQLLGDLLQTAAELAGHAESNADAYRAMREAWPRKTAVKEGP